jgi:hypothetical protein
VAAAGTSSSFADGLGSGFDDAAGLTAAHDLRPSARFDRDGFAADCPAIVFEASLLGEFFAALTACLCPLPADFFAVRSNVDAQRLLALPLGGADEAAGLCE